MATATLSEFMSDRFIIENDHQVIHALVRDLCSSASRSRDPQECKSVFLQIIEKLEEHFSAEEEAMCLHEYPDLKTHCAAHCAILKLYREGCENLITPNGKLSLAIIERGEAILARHVDKFDIELTHFLRDQEPVQLPEPALSRT